MSNAFYSNGHIILHPDNKQLGMVIDYKDKFGYYYVYWISSSQISHLLGDDVRALTTNLYNLIDRKKENADCR